MITTFHLPTKIIFGTGSLAQLGAEARRIGQKAILVTGSSSMRQTGVLDRVAHDLKANGVDTVTFDKVESNPRASTVDEGARMARNSGIDLVIGLGGGSAMDAAKGIVLASTGTRPIWDYIERKAEAKGTAIPLMLVPTVAASGSEGNNVAVIMNWETHEKRASSNPYFWAKVSIIDPELTLTLPQKTTAQGGVDIFCHLLEPYLTTKQPSPLTDGIMETAMRMVVKYLPQVLAKLDDIEARTQLSWASIIASSQFAQLGGGAGSMVIHGIDHTISARYDAAHGDSLAALLLAWMRYTFPAAKERFELLGKNVFGKADGILATEKWLEKVGMKLRLRDLGVEYERIEELANSAVQIAGWLKYNPRVLDAAAVVQIYRESY